MMAAAAKPTISPPERKPSGDRKNPEPAEGRDQPPALIKRIFDEAFKERLDRRVGTVLGHMYLKGILSEIEVEAGFAYAQDVGAYERIKGHPARHAQSPSFEFGRKGADDIDLEALERMDPEVHAKVIKRIKRKNKTIQKRYDRAQACIPLYPIIICTLLEEVCCNDRPIHSGHHTVVKQILRNLAERCYGLVQPGTDSQAKARPRTSRKVDAVMVASAAVDALEQWFAARKLTITEFNVVGATITGRGKVFHTISCRRSKIMAEMIAPQLIKAAEAKGWKEAPRSNPIAADGITEDAIRAGIKEKTT